MIRDIKILKDRVPSALNEKKMMIVDWMVKNNRITSLDIQEMFSISLQTVYKRVKELLRMGIIKPKGTGRATYYILG